MLNEIKKKKKTAQKEFTLYDEILKPEKRGRI